MTKILHIITGLDMGAPTQNTLLACYHLSDKYDSLIVHGLGRESKMADLEKQALDQRVAKVRAQGVKFIPLPALVSRTAPLKDIWTTGYLWRLIRNANPAIVHTHTSKAGILGCLAAKLAGVGYIVHTPYGHVSGGHFNRLTFQFFAVRERIINSCRDRLITQTEGECNDTIERSGCRPDKIEMIPRGVDIDPYLSAEVDGAQLKRSLGLPSGSILIGFVGGLRPRKAPLHLLQAMGDVWPQHPEAILVYVGKGELEADLRAEAVRRGVSDRVVFLGWRDDIPEVMQILDIFVWPSSNESMSSVLVEAMASGKPVVASRAGGIPDLVQHGETGLLVTPGDAGALAEGLLWLLAHPEEAKIMGQQGKAFSIQFHYREMVAKIDALYCELLQIDPFRSQLTFSYPPRTTARNVDSIHG
ncbi:MAG: glycosyltransferase family 4 protein [Desulfobacterales bacterium]|nr:MAG: glycosyltransferase family 4 protein [Desulfobacterales bacterium]